MVVGNWNYAYIDFQKDATEFSLIKIDIETGNYTKSFNFTQADIPRDIPEKSLSFDQMSQIYTDNSANEYVA